MLFLGEKMGSEFQTTGQDKVEFKLVEEIMKQPIDIHFCFGILFKAHLL